MKKQRGLKQNQSRKNFDDEIIRFQIVCPGVFYFLTFTGRKPTNWFEPEKLISDNILTS